MSEHDAIIRDHERLIEELRGNCARLQRLAGEALIERDYWRHVAMCADCNANTLDYCYKHKIKP
jgi:hypothetical protein